MRFDVVSLLPEMFVSLGHGLIGQAFQKKLAELHVHNPRQFTHDVHHTVDDRPFGGGDGMVLQAEPLARTLEAIRSTTVSQGPVILLSAHGEPISTRLCETLSKQEQLTLVCGRYGGVDQRFINQFVDRQVSVGDCVVSGGELPAMMLMDALLRLKPGVLGNEESARQESFYTGRLECPQFTRPREWRGQSVPPVLLSGNHSQMLQYQHLISVLVTEELRPDLLNEPEDVMKRAHRLKSQMSPAEKTSWGLK